MKRIPDPQSPQRAGPLWKHTCFETLVMPEGRGGYHEFNFSPSGDWCAYVFRYYRDGAELGSELVPKIRV